MKQAVHITCVFGGVRTTPKNSSPSSPDLKTELMNAIIAALDAHTAMSTQALGSAVRNRLKDALLGPAQLYESLRQ